MPKNEDLAVSPLRRSASGLLLFGINPFLVMVTIGVWLVALSASTVPASSLVVLVLAQVVWLSLACTAFLYRAQVSHAAVVTGFRWRPRRVPLAELTSVTIGKAARFGPRGSTATGMRLDFQDGRHAMVRESRSSSRRRLNEWAETIQYHAPWIKVHESPIAWETIRRDIAGSPRDDSYRRTTS